MKLEDAQAAFDTIAGDLLVYERVNRIEGKILNVPDYAFCDSWNDLPVELKIKNAQWLQELGAALEKDPQIKAWFKENRR